MMNRFIFADAAKCIGCRTCEVACAVAHRAECSVQGLTAQTLLSRIQVVKEGKVSVALACRQCEAAPCAGACPTGALWREGGAIRTRDADCIGCKHCMVVCPFGAINIVAAPADEGMQIVKCDLCHERAGGPACVSVCPTGALGCLDDRALTAAGVRKRQRMACAPSAME